jgi:hypothetical protein
MVNNEYKFSNENDLIHFWIAQRKKQSLIENWDKTSEVLLNDIRSRDYETIRNALYAIIGIGKKEMIPLLSNELEINGSKEMAEAYLNCGEENLEESAEIWANNHGYDITRTGGWAPISWGKL